MTILVKICGLTNPDDAATAIEAGADLVGFVFVRDTPRYVDPVDADWIAGLEGVETVGVFRDEALDEIRSLRTRLRLDRVQLHGNEPDRFLAELGPSTIRRVRPDATGAWTRVVNLHGRCLPLLDPGGGDGVSWSWQSLGAPPEGIQFGLAGGLTPDSVAEAVRTLQPALVDVSSGVEVSKGVKDPEKIREFINRARSASGS